MATLARTVIAKNTKQLLACLPKSFGPRPSLLSLSSNAELAELSPVLERTTPNTLGCLSAPLPGYENRITCSWATFESGHTFRSTLPGREPVQVGRWHSFRDKSTSPFNQPRLPTDWNDLWSSSSAPPSLPEELEKIPFPDTISHILYLTASAHEDLTEALDAFPDASKLGIIASSTPFVNGHPFTLFRGREVYHTGAVGIVLPKVLPTKIDYLGLEPISSSFTVTDSEGNLIVTLDNQNPTRALLSVIRKLGFDVNSSGYFKDNEEFYLGTVTNDASKPDQVFTITAGDPQRGTISLRTPSAPPVGSRVQFFRRPKSTPVSLALSQSDSKTGSLTFVTSSEFGSGADLPSFGDSAAAKDTVGDEEVLEFDVFVMASENGFVSTRVGERAWTCTVPGATARIGSG